MPLLPISIPEFRALLTSLWPSQPPAKLGLAISGGIDSMALAYLSSASKLSTPLHAFIVDHQARPESSREAHHVRSLLESLKIPVSILQLSWPLNTLPSAFETFARTARYQALARAMQAQDIRHLLLGHHADDLAETVMMRIVRNGRQEALAGMKPTARMPETNGVFGASDLHVGRPFLGVQKARLKATLEQAGKKWVEDPTNRDVTLTMRNAARKLLGEEPSRLPVALQTSSLLGVAERATEAGEELEEEINRVWEQKMKIQVDGLWGRAVVKLPPLHKRVDEMTDREWKVMHRVLTRVLEHVTPYDEVKRDALDGIINHHYVEGTRKFTAGGMTWEKIESSMRLAKRQPHSPASRQAVEIRMAMKTEDGWSEWKLFDGRWWIRCRIPEGHKPRYILIRPMWKTDLKRLKRFKEIQKQLQKRLSDNARFTIPVVALESDALRGISRDKRNDVVMGYPSICFDFYGGKERLRHVEWECKYREPL